MTDLYIFFKNCDERSRAHLLLHVKLFVYKKPPKNARGSWLKWILTTGSMHFLYQVCLGQCYTRDVTATITTPRLTPCMKFGNLLTKYNNFNFLTQVTNRILLKMNAYLILVIIEWWEFSLVFYWHILGITIFNLII